MGEVIHLPRLSRLSLMRLLMADLATYPPPSGLEPIREPVDPVGHLSGRPVYPASGYLAAPQLSDEWGSTPGARILAELKAYRPGRRKARRRAARGY